MSKKVYEGEVLSESSTVSRDGRQENFEPLTFPRWRIFISLIPVFGLIFAVLWFYYERSKKSPMIVFTIIGIVIGIFSTVTFLVLKFILKAIF